MFDSSLRTPVIYAIAVRYQTPMWRAGAMLRAGCMAGFWLLLPFTLVYELVLRGARDALATQARRYRADDAVTVHSLVKNAAYALISEVDSDSGAGAETRSLAREMLALTEEARLLVLGRAAELGSVELLWHCVTRILPSGGQAMAQLDPASRSVRPRPQPWAAESLTLLAASEPG